MVFVTFKNIRYKSIKRNIINMAGRYTKYLGFIIPVTIIVAVLCITAMAGWIFNIGILASVLPGFNPMKFNTAVSLLLLSLAVLFFTHYRKLNNVAQFLAIVGLTLGVLSLSQHLFKLEPDINGLFLDDDVEYGQEHILIMSPQSALCISVMALSLLMLNTRNTIYRVISQYLFHLITLVCFVVLIGYAYNVPYLQNFSTPYSMPFLTAFLFLFLSVASSMINPTLGITGIFTGNMIGNFMARRLFFSLLAGILCAGYIGILTHRYHVISAELGVALLTLSFCLITLVFIWIVSILLNKAYLKLKIAKENLNMVVEAAPFALVLSDNKGDIIEVNKHAEKVFGFLRNEMIGENVSMLIPEESRTMWMEKRNSFFADPTQPTPFNDEILAQRKNGSKFPIEIVLKPITTDEGLKVLSFVIDITLRKRNEELIQKQLIELQSKNQELEQFNYISSHDLQEPLRTVLNYIQLLDEDYPELSSEVKTHLSAMQSSVMRMSNVVKSLLEFGRLGRNRKLKLTDCKLLIHEVLSDLNTAIKDSGAIITVCEGHPKVFAYETELRQLFQNLISNAIKFRRKDAIPRIEITCRKLNGYYEFSVSDNGIGISSKYFERIFNIFQRLNKESEFEGHGIGLANCRKIAEMHGGKIWVESEEGKGSTFTFRILNFKP